MNTLTNSQKRDKLLDMIETGRSIHILLDPRGHRVLVPERFTKKSQLKLLYGLNTCIPIPDLEFTDYGILATLSFNNKGHQTYVPYEAIYGTGFEGEQYECLDEEVFKGTLPESSQAPAVPKKPSKSRGHLRLVVDNT